MPLKYNIPNFINKLIFSSLTKRILTLNLTALCLVLGGVIYIENFHSNLLKNEFNAMQNQAFIISDVISATLNSNDKNLLIKLARHNNLRLCVYNMKSEILFDTSNFYKPKLMGKNKIIAYSTPIENEKLKSVLKGQTQFWQAKQASMILNSATPIIKQGKIQGCLYLTSFTSKINRTVHIVNLKILLFSILISGIFCFLSLYLAYTIAAPLRRLSIAAKRVSNFKNPPTTIPQFIDRYDEIDSLAKAMQRMAQAFYDRLEIMESFAQDVSHELKNPLASIASALQTLQVNKIEKQRITLQNIIMNDVKRMNLLITDIADASRIDAELARDSYRYVDIEKMIKLRINTAKKATQNQNIKFYITKKTSLSLMVQGHELRLAQVFDNLIANAVSFAPPKKAIIKIILNANEHYIIVIIEDNGSGIKAKKISTIFERFYTQREKQCAFGVNSGLGLTISKQIIEAHKGNIKAENILDDSQEIIGARFIVNLPKVRQIVNHNNV